MAETSSDNNISIYQRVAANWWERTPNSGNANNVRLVNTDGTLNNNNANNANGLAPDCEIVRFE